MNAVELYAKATPGFDERLDHAVAALRHAACEHGGGIVQATSLGAEDMVVTELIARHRLDIAVGTLETGMLHTATLALIGRIEARYGVAVEAHQPSAESVLHFVAAHGEDAMYASIELRKRCCAIRKVEPLQRLLAGRSAWVTGLRRGQSSQRGEVPFSALDDRGRTRYNPLADWSWADVWHCIATFDVPYNPLHDRFFPSIGCAPCTRAVALGEDFRAGRWWWEHDAVKECGLHLRNEAAGETARTESTTGATA